MYVHQKLNSANDIFQYIPSRKNKINSAQKRRKVERLLRIAEVCSRLRSPHRYIGPGDRPYLRASRAGLCTLRRACEHAVSLARSDEAHIVLTLHCLCLARRGLRSYATPCTPCDGEFRRPGLGNGFRRWLHADCLFEDRGRGGRRIHVGIGARRL
jgi:hypothetical protein